VYPVLPLLIPGEILTKLESFWDQMEKGTSESQYPDLEFYGLIHAIWYAGALSISGKGLQRWFPGVVRAKLAAQFHDQVVFCLHLGSFSRNITLDKLAALIMLHTLPVAEEDPIQGSLYMQLTLRLALTMGLHREPTLFDLTVAEEGMRRRLWWQIIQLDTTLVVSSGYPSLISEAFCDTRINCEDRDAEVADDKTPSANLDKSSRGFSWGEPHSEGENGNLTSHRTMSLVGRAKSIMACALRAVISIHLGTKMLTNADMQAMKRVMHDACQQIDDIIMLIPSKGLPEMGFVPNGQKEGQQRTLDCDAVMGGPLTPNELAYYKTYVSDDDLVSPVARYHRQKLAAFNKWARISISMLKDKLQCVAYAPFLKNARSKLWSMGRQCALHNCHSFLRKFISLATEPDLEAFRWSWPMMYGPMHAALIVLVDVYERPHSVEAPRSRELIDQTFSLSAPDSGIVGGPNGVTVQRPLREGGVGAWDMLRGLRSAAWQKAGLDPTVLWTEADQLEIGIAAPLTHAQKIAQSLREDSIYDNERTETSGTAAALSAKPPNKPTITTGSSETGVRYLVKLAHNELAGSADEHDGYPCSRAIRNQFLQHIENDARLDRSRGLARREGQQPMPFPLTGRMAACSGRAAGGDEHSGSNSCSKEAALHPTLQMLGCPNNLSNSSTVPGTEHPAQEGPGVPHLDQAASAFGVSTPIHTEDLGHANGTKVNGTAAPNGFSNGFPNSYPNGYVDHQHLDNKHAEPSSHHDAGAAGTEPPHNGDDTLSMSSSDLGFDWERWDAVFGQFSGFTDMMDDVTWEGLDHD
jgi:hypothetical protein